MVKQSNQDKIKYRVQLNTIVDCIRFLLCRGLAFRGHDESQGSSDKGSFLKLLPFLGGSQWIYQWSVAKSSETILA